MTEPRPYTAIGLMSGTSADGVDAAILQTDGTRILATGAFLTRPYPDRLRSDVLALMRDPDRAEHGAETELERAVTNAHAEIVRALLAKSGRPTSSIDVVGFHGQTVLHRPERRFTRQLGFGDELAEAVGIAVVSRFRHDDVAAGGQGAPLAPLFHAALAHGMPGPLAVLNLGGVGNVTCLDGDMIVAFDTGPANALIDDWVRRHIDAHYDADGAIAGSGTPDGTILTALLDNPYFARTPPKSLDRNAFPDNAVDGLSLADGAATLAGFTALSVARAREHLPRAPIKWLVTGGGRHNATLMRLLRGALGVPVMPVETVGWDGDALEAQAFGYLAVRTLLGLPLSLPSTTGVPVALTGGKVSRPAIVSASIPCGTGNS
jgi:anhydro-N-acetylmuramic acid kinase